MIEEGAPQVNLSLDFQQLKNISVLGVRRAAAFIAIALNATENVADQSLALPSASMWRFFPEPVPNELLLNSVAEFRVWVVGCAMRELDAAFNDFVDLAWAMNEWSKLHGHRVRSDHTIRTISAKTNAGAKLQMLFEEIGVESLDVRKLKSLSNLRNCLTHARGLVTERHCNVEGALQVEWLGFELGFEQEGIFTPMPQPIPSEGVAAPDPSAPASIVLKVVDKSASFKKGAQVLLKPDDLHEMCQFYLGATDRAAAFLLNAVKGRGLENVDPLSQNSSGQP